MAVCDAGGNGEGSAQDTTFAKEKKYTTSTLKAPMSDAVLTILKEMT